MAEAAGAPAARASGSGAEPLHCTASGPPQARAQTRGSRAVLQTEAAPPSQQDDEEERARWDERRAEMMELVQMAEEPDPQDQSDQYQEELPVLEPMDEALPCEVDNDGDHGMATLAELRMQLAASREGRLAKGTQQLYRPYQRLWEVRPSPPRRPASRRN